MMALSNLQRSLQSDPQILYYQWTIKSATSAYHGSTEKCHGKNVSNNRPIVLWGVHVNGWGHTTLVDHLSSLWIQMLIFWPNGSVLKKLGGTHTTTDIGPICVTIAGCHKEFARAPSVSSFFSLCAPSFLPAFVSNR